MPFKAMKKFFNDYIFSPARFFNQNGLITNRGHIVNFVAAPDTKIAAISTLAAAFFHAVNGSPDLKIASLKIGALVLAWSFLSEDKDGRTKYNIYHFDTRPPIKMNLANDYLEASFKKTCEEKNINIGIQSALSAFWGAACYVATDDLAISATTYAIVTSQGITKTLTYWWQAKQVLDGNWNVLYDIEPTPIPFPVTMHKVVPTI